MKLRFDKVAEVLCEALSLDPDGMRTEFLPSGPKSETFRDMHRPAAWAAAVFFRDELKRFSETLPVEFYGIQPAIKWLDEQLDLDAATRQSGIASGDVRRPLQPHTDTNEFVADIMRQVNPETIYNMVVARDAARSSAERAEEHRAEMRMALREIVGLLERLQP